MAKEYNAVVLETIANILLSQVLMKFDMKEASSQLLESLMPAVEEDLEMVGMYWQSYADTVDKDKKEFCMKEAHKGLNLQFID